MLPLYSRFSNSKNPLAVLFILSGLSGHFILHFLILECSSLFFIFCLSVKLLLILKAQGLPTLETICSLHLQTLVLLSLSTATFKVFITATIFHLPPTCTYKLLKSKIRSIFSFLYSRHNGL